MVTYFMWLHVTYITAMNVELFSEKKTVNYQEKL